MKKMRNGKRGFTLLEIITVVAIIVIIAGAAVVGVTVTLQRASATKAYLEANNGRNFESEARNTVKNLTVNTVDWSPIPKYTPQNLAKKKWDELLAFGWTEEELGGELKYRDNGWYIEALEGDPSDAWDPAKHNGLTLDQYTEMKNTVNSYLMAGYTMDEIGLTYGGPEGFSINPQWNPGLHDGKPVPGTVITPDPTKAPVGNTNTPTPVATATPVPQQEQHEDPVPQPAVNNKPANISNMDGTVSAGSAKSATPSVSKPNYQGSTQAYDVSVDSGNGSQVYSVTIKVTGANPSLDNPDYRYSIEDLGGGKFKITYTQNSKWNQPMVAPTFRITTDTGSGCSVEVDSIEYYSE